MNLMCPIPTSHGYVHALGRWAVSDVTGNDGHSHASVGWGHHIRHPGRPVWKKMADDF